MATASAPWTTALMVIGVASNPATAVMSELFRNTCAVTVRLIGLPQGSVRTLYLNQIEPRPSGVVPVSALLGWTRSGLGGAGRTTVNTAAILPPALSTIRRLSNRGWRTSHR